MKEWVVENLEGSCPSCKAANGQRHEMSEWEEAEIVPGSVWLYCGSNCKCKLEEVGDCEAVGNLGDIPLRDFDLGTGEVVNAEVGLKEMAAGEDVEKDGELERVIDIETGLLHEIVEVEAEVGEKELKETTG